MPKNVFNLCFDKRSSVDAVTWFEFLLCPIKMLMLKSFLDKSMESGTYKGERDKAHETVLVRLVELAEELK